jgi:hypothetical protein
MIDDKFRFFRGEAYAKKRGITLETGSVKTKSSHHQGGCSNLDGEPGK